MAMQNNMFAHKKGYPVVLSQFSFFGSFTYFIKLFMVLDSRLLAVNKPETFLCSNTQDTLQHYLGITLLFEI